MILEGVEDEDRCYPSTYQLFQFISWRLSITFQFQFQIFLFCLTLIYILYFS